MLKNKPIMYQGGGSCSCCLGAEVLDLLDDLKIKNIDTGIKLKELHKLIALGDWQLQEMYRLGKGGRSNLEWYWNKEKIKKEIVSIWNGLDEYQQKALTKKSFF